MIYSIIRDIHNNLLLLLFAQKNLIRRMVKQELQKSKCAFIRGLPPSQKRCESRFSRQVSERVKLRFAPCHIIGSTLLECSLEVKQYQPHNNIII
jgi:hypothetical protein